MPPGQPSKLDYRTVAALIGRSSHKQLSEVRAIWVQPMVQESES